MARSNGAILFVSVSLLAMQDAAVAQGVDLSGDIRAGIARSDNIYLLPSPDETDETTYVISPSLELGYKNQRIDSLLKYQFDWFRYSDLGQSNKYHRYDARLNGTLVPDSLYLDLGASRSQSVVDPDSVIPPSGLPISNNLTDRDEYFVKPSLEKTLGRSVTVVLDYRYADVRYGDSGSAPTQQVQDNKNHTANFKLENYKRGQGLTWATTYEWQKLDYDFSLPWKYQRASGELGLWVSGSTRVFASGGKESAWDDPVDGSLSDGFWEAGFAYKNGERASAEFAAGERSFGSSWRGRLDWSFRRGSLSFSYAETPTTSGFNRFSGGNLINPDEPNDYLAYPRSSERYISERGQASLGLEFRRTAVNLTAYDEQRTGIIRDDGTPVPDESQKGVSVSMDWSVGPRTDVTASGALNSRKNELGDKFDYITGRFSASYRLGNATDLTLAYFYAEQDPDAGSNGRDYVSNIVSFYVTYSF